MAKIEGHMRGKRYSAPKLTVYGKIGELTNQSDKTWPRMALLGSYKRQPSKIYYV